MQDAKIIGTNVMAPDCDYLDAHCFRSLQQHGVSLAVPFLALCWLWVTLWAAVPIAAIDFDKQAVYLKVHDAIAKESLALEVNTVRRQPFGHHFFQATRLAFHVAGLGAVVVFVAIDMRGVFPKGLAAVRAFDNFRAVVAIGEVAALCFVAALWRAVVGRFGAGGNDKERGATNAALFFNPTSLAGLSCCRTLTCLRAVGGRPVGSKLLVGLATMRARVLGARCLARLRAETRIFGQARRPLILSATSLTDQRYPRITALIRAIARLMCTSGDALIRLSASYASQFDHSHNMLQKRMPRLLPESVRSQVAEAFGKILFGWLLSGKYPTADIRIIAQLS